MDGTLVDSRLDFDRMRAEMELPPGRPILEAIAELAEHRAASCREVLRRHEWEGVRQATMMPGALELLEELARRTIPVAIATRNSREVTRATLAKLNLQIELVMTREDGPIKPDPWAIQHACRRWGIEPGETAIVGDFRLDIEAGHAAGAWTVLLTHPEDPGTWPNHEKAHLLLSSLADYRRLLAWMDGL
jgi:phosphoglycolate phosphatase